MAKRVQWPPPRLTAQAWQAMPLVVLLPEKARLYSEAEVDDVA